MEILRVFVVATVLGCWPTAGAARASVIHLTAIDSTSRYLTETAYSWPSGGPMTTLNAYGGQDVHLIISYGYAKFDVSAIPDDATITGLVLSATVRNIQVDNPDENAP